MKKILSFYIILLSCCVFVSCSDDEEEIYNPVFTIDVPDNAETVDLRKYYYGRTLLGWSDVFITYEDVFDKASNESVLVNIGSKRTTLLSQPQMKMGGDWSYNDTVIPGNFYQIFRKEDYSKYSQAVKVGSTFMNAHVDSWLYEKGKNVGAKITYVETVACDEFLDTCFQNLKFYSPRNDEDYRRFGFRLPDSTYFWQDHAEIIGGQFSCYQYFDSIIASSYGPAQGTVDLAIHHNGCYVIRRIKVEPDPE